jgi:hypothetical protein
MRGVGGVGRGVTSSVCCLPVSSAALCKQLCNQPAERNSMPLFSARQGIGMLSTG